MPFTVHHLDPITNTYNTAILRRRYFLTGDEADALARAEAAAGHPSIIISWTLTDPTPSLSYSPSDPTTPIKPSPPPLPQSP